MGFPNPPRLRSESEPWGLSKLSGVRLERVQSANRIYVLIAKVIAKCIERRILFSIENPWRSYFWWVPPIAQFLRHPALQSRVHHTCMLGGDRNKLQRWLVLKGTFLALDNLCDNSHFHKPWGMRMENGVPIFDTEGEAEFPTLLCEVVADSVLNSAIADGFAAPAQQLDHALSQNQSRLKMAASVGKQPRGRKLPPLVSEFSTVDEIVLPPTQKLQLLESQKLLRSYLRAEAGSDEIPATVATNSNEETSNSSKARVHIVGTRRTPAEFHEAALAAQHPFQPGEGISDEHKLAFAEIFSRSPLGLAKTRITNLKEVLGLKKELAEKEATLHSQLPSYARKISEGKCFLLFEALLKRWKYPDIGVVQQMIEGFKTTGRTPDTGLWEKRLVPSTTNDDELRKNSTWIRAAILPQIKSTDDRELEEVTWKQTLQEQEDGWLSEPVSALELDEKYQKRWLPIPRFGLRQGKKIRNIDDCKRPDLNAALTTTEKLRLQDIDYNVSLCLFIGRTLRHAAASDRHFSFYLSDGSKLDYVVHAEWGDLEKLAIKGRTLDLKSAYKNLFIHPDSIWAAIVSTWNPFKNKVEHRESFALMFGATSSVFGFNRVSRALQFLASKVLHLIAAQFYDDFPCYEPSVTARLARSSFEGLLAALGWKWAVGDKAPDFGNLFSELGVVFDLSSLCSNGDLTISNKQSRIDGIVSSIDDCLEKDSLQPCVASELVGKLQFCGGQFLGEFARAAVKRIRDRSNSKVSTAAIKCDHDLTVALNVVKTFLREAPPRTISCQDLSEPVIIYTDGASESSGHTWGAVIFGLSAKPMVASGEVEKELTDFWLSTVGTQIICQVEFYPLLLLRCILGKKLVNRRILWFIDNDPVRDALISGNSDSAATTALLYCYNFLQLKEPSFNWYARVPSFSNHADEPSRRQGAKKACELRGTLHEDWVLPAAVIADLIAEHPSYLR